jgi:hypothetical protein
MQTIEITVSPKGEAVVQTKGFSGPSCRDASRALEKALGIVRSDAPTAEMHLAQAAEQPLRQGNG